MKTLAHPCLTDGYVCGEGEIVADIEGTRREDGWAFNYS